MEKLFLGVGNHVVCIEKNTGKEIWRTKVKSSTIVNIYCENDCVFAYAGGHLFCLKTSTGKEVWSNSLKGLGYGTCIIASGQQSTSVISSQVASQQAAAAGVAATGAAASSS